MKDVLRARELSMVRWRGRATEGLVGAGGRDDVRAELRFLEREVYLREVELQQDVSTAFDRYRPG